jgi:hypothetical protein
MSPAHIVECGTVEIIKIEKAEQCGRMFRCHSVQFGFVGKELLEVPGIACRPGHLAGCSEPSAALGSRDGNSGSSRKPIISWATKSPFARGSMISSRLRSPR